MNRTLAGLKVRSRLIFVSCLLLLALGCGAGAKKIDHASEAGYYTCTMHPQVHEHEPGNCPICGMKLVYISKQPGKMPADMDKTGQGRPSTTMEKSDVPEIAVTGETLEALGIQIFKVERKKGHKSITAPGRVAYDPELYQAIVE